MLKFREIGVFLKKTSRDPVGTQPPDIGARLDPDWIPTERCPKMLKLVPDWVPTGSRRDPDWIDRQEPTPAPIFPFPDPPLPLFSFSAHQPCTNTPPSCTKTAKAVLSQTGVLQNIQVNRCKLNTRHFLPTI